MANPVDAMPLPGLHTPAAGFDEPFELLQACHERVQRTLALLRRLRGHLIGHGCDEQARQAARDVLRYFDIAAPLHHQDEELHVFPPLLAAADPAIRLLVQALQEDHRQMAWRWQAARAALMQVAQGEASSWPGLTAEQQQALDDFVALYDDHIASEELLVYPAAKARLTAQDAQAMGTDMMRRRGASPPPQA